MYVNTTSSSTGLQYYVAMITAGNSAKGHTWRVFNSVRYMSASVISYASRRPAQRGLPSNSLLGRQVQCLQHTQSRDLRVACSVVHTPKLRVLGDLIS